MSMFSEKRAMNPYALESEVPPLNGSRGPPACRPLKRASSVQQTKKSFSDHRRAAMTPGYATLMAASANDRRDLFIGAGNCLGTVQQNIEWSVAEVDRF
jgi:hypothetical protein